MSRIGKVAIVIPDKVDVKVANNLVTVKGPRGELSCQVHSLIKISIENKQIHVTPVEVTRQASSQWGTARTQISNLVRGVSAGFVKSLEFNGVGYKAVVQGDILQLSLGYSHNIDFKLPKGITAKVTKNQIDIEGSSKEQVGQVAAVVRSFREPEPYKGKGLKYTTETITRKAGKSSGKGK